jgi:hypothetical protein
MLSQLRDYPRTSIDHLGRLSLGSFLVPLPLGISFVRSDATALPMLLLLGLGARVGGGCMPLVCLITLQLAERRDSGRIPKAEP